MIRCFFSPKPGCFANQAIFYDRGSEPTVFLSPLFFIRTASIWYATESRRFCGAAATKKNYQQNTEHKIYEENEAISAQHKIEPHESKSQVFQTERMSQEDKLFFQTYRTLRGFGETSVLLRHAVINLPAISLMQYAHAALRHHRHVLHTTNGIERIIGDPADRRFRIKRVIKFPLTIFLRIERRKHLMKLAMLRYRVQGRKLFLDIIVTLFIASVIFVAYASYRVYWVANRRDSKMKNIVATHPMFQAVNNLELEARQKIGMIDEDGDTVF